VALQKKFETKKSKSMSSSTQQNGFGPAFLHMMLKLAQGTAKAKSIFNGMVLIRLCDLAKKQSPFQILINYLFISKTTNKSEIRLCDLAKQNLTSKF
jgi:hypothetical protein